MDALENEKYVGRTPTPPKDKKPMTAKGKAILAICIITIAFILISPFYFWPKYRVWQEGLAGAAQLAKATQNRQIAVEVAKAKLESAGLEAKAEIERAKGVAEANKIIGDSLKGNEAYLRYLWINGLQTNNEGPQVIYVPTEAGLPILEAGRAVTTNDSKHEKTREGQNVWQ